MKYLVTILGLSLYSNAFSQSTSTATVATMGYVYPEPVYVAPGQLITVFLAGNIQGTISATVQNLTAPVLEVQPPQNCPSAGACFSTTAVTIQIPYDVGPSCIFTNPACDLSALTQLVITVNSIAGTPFDLTPQADQVHMLTSCDTVVPGGSGLAPLSGLPCAPLVTHADGTLVAAGSPAQGGEVLIAYAVGLGLTTPAVATGQPAAAATPTTEIFDLDFNFRPNALATKPGAPGLFPAPPGSILIPQYTGLAPGYVGLYQVNFLVPTVPLGLPGCSGTIVSNLTVSLGGLASFDGAGICVLEGGL